MMTLVVATTYRRRVSLGSGEARTKDLEMSVLRSSSAFCVPSILRKESDIFSNLYREPTFPQLRHEVVEGCEASHESLDVLDIPDLPYLGDGRDLVRVSFDVALGDNVPQEHAPGDPKRALLWVQPDVKVPEAIKGFLKVGDETVALSGLHDDVIDIDFQVAPYLPFEIELHALLVGGPAFFSLNDIFA
jgi:hypothetical protein